MAHLTKRVIDSLVATKADQFYFDDEPDEPKIYMLTISRNSCLLDWESREKQRNGGIDQEKKARLR